jgi:hypothetical protein
VCDQKKITLKERHRCNESYINRLTGCVVSQMSFLLACWQQLQLGVGATEPHRFGRFMNGVVNIS